MQEDMINHFIIENLSEGIIAVDSNECVKIINRRAKEIFGIVSKQDVGHDSGVISQGDIVIIGDNTMGFDDGGLNSSDLRLIGIEEEIPMGSSLLYIGRYKGHGKYLWNKGSTGENMFLNEKIGDISASVGIDFIKRIINISIDSYEFPYRFVKGIGHIVILDGNTGRVKFYQSKGYSVRKEDIKTLLNGGVYMEKLTGVEMETDVIGENLHSLLEPCTTLEALKRAADGGIVDYKRKYDEINGRPVRCSVFPLVKGDLKTGAFLTVEDLSEFNELIKERNEVLERLSAIRDMIYDPFNIIIGESKKIKDIKSSAKRAAESDSTIILLGESGTGKSLMARAIHEYSARRHKRFIEINCGAISENLLESELFGYAPYTFTGGRREGKKGLVEAAEGGTLFLDEISEMPLNLQVKLLHVIQNRRITPVGDINPIDVDVRIICATNKDLIKMVSDKKFREDLYYRINVIPINIPPLREHKEDIYHLCQFILQRICERYKSSYKILSNEAYYKLYNYDFPGNIRELENILERAVNISDANIISQEEIQINSEVSHKIKPLKEIVEDAEKKAMVNAIIRYGRNKEKVLEVLGIKKTSFYEKLKRYNIDYNSVVTENFPK